jgi:hypothetical protein
MVRTATVLSVVAAITERGLMDPLCHDSQERTRFNLRVETRQEEPPVRAESPFEPMWELLPPEVPPGVDRGLLQRLLHQAREQRGTGRDQSRPGTGQA